MTTKKDQRCEDDYGPGEKEIAAEIDRNLDMRRSPMEVFQCGPAPGHVCDDKGQTVDIGSGRCSGESASRSVCGMSAFDRSMWDDL